MLNKILNLIKKIIPKRLFKLGQPIYHYILSKFSALIYGYPSNKMIVVGVTGTTGKSSSCYFMSQILESAGFKVGISTTTIFKVGDKEWLNDKKMTMIGRFQLQKLLKQMVKNECDIAIVETTSEGIKQFRHLGISYDILVFTNLYPEHIESHGSFEKYKQAKGKLFKYLSKTKKKKVEKTIIANLDDEHAEYFLNFKADKKVTYGIDKDADIKLNDLKINLLGDYNRYNVLSGVAVANVLKVKEDKIKFAVENLKPLPGRLEFIENNKGIKILVDYAFEPKAVQKLYDTIKNVEYNKIIHILGSTGGGRDKDRRPALGKLASDNADIVIVTNEDPYDEDPMEIINQISSEVDNNKLHKILDRREAIHKALELAKKDDLILVTGKGAEQKMCLANGEMIDWDDRRIVREEMTKID
ncbi:MAG: Mur ligase family protein [Patescibacteria group bacterium]